MAMGLPSMDSSQPTCIRQTNKALSHPVEPLRNFQIHCREGLRESCVELRPCPKAWPVFGRPFLSGSCCQWCSTRLEFLARREKPETRMSGTAGWPGGAMQWGCSAVLGPVRVCDIVCFVCVFVVLFVCFCLPAFVLVCVRARLRACLVICLFVV